MFDFGTVIVIVIFSLLAYIVGVFSGANMLECSYEYEREAARNKALQYEAEKETYNNGRRRRRRNQG